MIDTKDRSSVFTTTSIPALSQVTVYAQLLVASSSLSVRQYAWHLGGNIKIGVPGVWVEDGKLWYSNWDTDLIIGATQGEWSTPIADGHHIVGVKFDMSNQRTMDPIIYIDGSLATVTEEQTPSANSLAHNSDVMNFGAYFFYNSAWGAWLSKGSSWQGKIGEFYLHTGLHSAAQMERLTRFDVKRKAMHLESASLTYYFPFDEISDQVQVGTTYTLTPNGDATSLWSTKTAATYWQSVEVDNETDYIRATGTDDNEEQIFDFSTQTIPAGTTAYGVEITLKGLHSDVENCEVKLYIDSVAYSLGSTDFGYTTEEGVKFYRINITQSQIDSLQVGLKVGSVAKGEYLQISYLKVDIITANNKWDDWVGGLQAVSQDAVGWAEMKQTYP